MLTCTRLNDNIKAYNEGAPADATGDELAAQARALREESPEKAVEWLSRVVRRRAEALGTDVDADLGVILG